MVRTRNNRGGGGDDGGGNSNKESSSSLKPASLSSRLATGAAAKKKGRKRQLGEGSSREEEEMGLELTHSAALSPVAGPSSGTPVAQRGESRSAVAAECHERSSAPPGGQQDQSMEQQQSGNHVWGHVAHQRQDPAEQGYLAPPINYNNNNYQDEQEEQALSEPCSSASGGQGSAMESHHGEEGGQEVADLVVYRETGGHISGAESKDGEDSSLVLPEDLKANLECPVCARISLPPIMQCRNGHVTCNPCRIKVQSCPMCREIDIDIRNLFAEKAVTFMSIPCEFRTYGCRVEIQYKEKEAHERICKYRPYICPYIECDHKLAADAVVLHVSSAHREECRRSDGPEITASMILIGQFFGGDGAWSPRVITCFGRTFFDVALTRDRWLHHWVWLLGEEEEAAHFTYEITAFKGNTKYVYGSEVASLRTSDDEIVSEGKCLSISDAIGRRLRDGDKIRYKLKLMRK